MPVQINKCAFKSQDYLEGGSLSVFDFNILYPVDAKTKTKEWFIPSRLRLRLYFVAFKGVIYSMMITKKQWITRNTPFCFGFRRSQGQLIVLSDLHLLCYCDFNTRTSESILLFIVRHFLVALIRWRTCPSSETTFLNAVEGGYPDSRLSSKLLDYHLFLLLFSLVNSAAAHPESLTTPQIYFQTSLAIRTPPMKCRHCLLLYTRHAFSPFLGCFVVFGQWARTSHRYL